MGRNWRTWARSLSGALLALAFVELARADETLPPPAPVAVAPLSLQQLVDLAVQNNPEVAAAQARAMAARGRLVQAGLYPNPTITWEAEDMRFTGDHAAANQGPIFDQQIVTARKLRIAQAAASHGVAVAEWQALTRWYDVVTRTRMAYFEVLTAQRTVQAAEEIVGLARESLQAAKDLQKGGAGTKPDVIRAQVEVDQTQVQLQVAQQRLTAAWQVLAAVLGMPEVPCGQLVDMLAAPPPAYDWLPALAAVTSMTSPVQEAQAAVLQGEQLLRLAVAQRVPDMRVGVRPLYAFGEQRGEMTVWIGAPVPIFNRNQGNILAAEADLARLRADAGTIELRLRELLAGAFQRYQSARRQVEAYQKDILPNARESVRLIREGYDRGDAKYDFTTLQQAQRTLFQARLAYVQSLGELWRAVSEIAGLLQQEALEGGCAEAGAGAPPRQGE